MANIYMGMVLICDDLSRQNLGPPAKGLTFSELHEENNTKFKGSKGIRYYLPKIGQVIL